MIFLGFVLLSICLIIILAEIVSICKLDEQTVARSILYDDPEYFYHDEPKWMRGDDN